MPANAIISVLALQAARVSGAGEATDQPALRQRPRARQRAAHPAGWRSQLGAQRRAQCVQREHVAVGAVTGRRAGRLVDPTRPELARPARSVAGLVPAASPREVGGRPSTIQCTNTPRAASGSSITSTSWRVPPGAADHRRGSALPCPEQVKRVGIDPPGAKAGGC